MAILRAFSDTQSPCASARRWRASRRTFGNSKCTNTSRSNSYMGPFRSYLEDIQLWTCFTKSFNESSLCRTFYLASDLNISRASLIETLFRVGDISPSATLFYKEFGLLIFVLNFAFLLFSGIAFVMADWNKSDSGNNRYTYLSQDNHGANPNYGR